MYSVHTFERPVKIEPFEFGFPELFDDSLFDFDTPLPPKLACSPENQVMQPRQSLLQYQQFLIQPELDSYADSCTYDDWSSSVSSAGSSPLSSPQIRERIARKYSQSQKCHICHKVIRRDLSRHLRIHNPVARFHCFLPRDQCLHKTGQFNRPYDFKKHMLNCHFQFDDQNVRKLHNLKEKLNHYGSCPCGLRTTGEGWLDHFLHGKCHISGQYFR